MSNKKIERLITKARIAIHNCLLIYELQTMFAVFGYTLEKINQGKTLLDVTSDLNLKYQKKYGKKYTTTNELDEKVETAYIPYIKYLQIARIAFAKEPEAWTALALGGERKESYTGLLTQFRQFFTNLLNNPRWLKKMADYGITDEKLVIGQNLVEEVETLLHRQKIEMGESKKAILLRDEAADNLQEWYSEFKVIACIALEVKPHYLEMLGIVKKYPISI